MVVAHSVVGIPQYNMIVKYELKGCAKQADLMEEQQTIVDTSIETLYGDIVLNFKKLLVEEWGNDIIVNGPQNFIYKFADTIGEGHG